MKRLEEMFKCLQENGLDEFNNRYVITEGADAAGLIAGIGALMGFLIGTHINEKIKEKATEKVKKQSKPEKNKQREEFLQKYPKDKLIDDVTNDAKKIVDGMKKDPKLKAAINEKLEKLAKDGDYTKEELKAKIVFNNEGDYIEIIDGSQDVRIELSFIISNIIDVLENKYAEAVALDAINISSGDGDEGCLYIE